MNRASSMVLNVSPIHHLCFIPVFFTTNISIPKILKLLKLPQLNLSDVITHVHSTTFPHVLYIIQSIFLKITSPRILKKREANPIALHVVPNHHPRIFPIFYTLWSPQRSKILFWNYLSLTFSKMIQSFKYIQLLAKNFQSHQFTPSTMEHSFEITST